MEMGKKDKMKMKEEKINENDKKLTKRPVI